ncbi:MAG TPA: efflux RND transporter periplasmic adaptor subunit [Candidatus Dormibacteraeota bacterium]|nr:efflux RND transporter periplasmic adaptor subunit [Candidatus Dormibacteraeota bacterium]
MKTVMIKKSQQVISRLSHLGCGAILLLACGCSKTAPEPEPVVSVQVEPAKRGPITETISAEAVVFPVQQSVIAPKITSTVRTFYVQRGSRVKKGQELVQLENADLTAAAEQSKGDFEQAQASYAATTGATIPEQVQKAELDAAAAKSNYDAQKKVYEARKTLFEQGAIPRKDLDAANVALSQANSQNEQAQKQLQDLQRIGKQLALKTADAQLTSANAKYLGARAALSYSIIRSPINGVVTDRPLFPGEAATANQPILTVMDLSRVIAKAHIPGAQAALIKVGNPAEIKIPNVDEPVKAKVTLVSPALDPGSTTIEVWVETAKPPAELKPGMTVEVIITSKTAKDALLVPASAVFKSDTGEIVLVAGSDEKAHQTPVQTGIRNKEDVQILSGIKEGDQVITSGGYALPDKTPIKIEAPAKDEKAGDAGGKADAADEAKPDAKGAKPNDTKAPAKDATGGKADNKPAEKDEK